MCGEGGEQGLNTSLIYKSVAAKMLDFTGDISLLTILNLKFFYFTKTLLFVSVFEVKVLFCKTDWLLPAPPQHSPVRLRPPPHLQLIQLVSCCVFKLGVSLELSRCLSVLLPVLAELCV